MTPRIITADEARAMLDVAPIDFVRTATDNLHPLAATVVAQAAEITRLTALLAASRAALIDLAPRCDFVDCDDIATHWSPTVRRVEHACVAHAADDPRWTEGDHTDALRALMEPR